jgi:hypothetical protein
MLIVLPVAQSRRASSGLTSLLECSSIPFASVIHAASRAHVQPSLLLGSGVVLPIRVLPITSDAFWRTVENRRVSDHCRLIV